MFRVFLRQIRRLGKNPRNPETIRDIVTLIFAISANEGNANVGLKDLIPGSRAKAAPPAAPPRPAPTERVAPVAHYVPGTWPAERRDVLEEVWGKGCVAPGTPEDIAALMNVCALSSAKTMLALGAGLGGPARHLVHKFGVWLVGLERDEALAAEAGRQALVEDIDKKALFYAADYETLALKPSGYDAVLCRDVLSSVTNREGMIEQFAEALKPSAHLVIVDFVVGETRGNEAVLKRVFEGETPRLQPLRAQQIAASLKKRNFLIHVAKDITDETMPRIVEGWGRFAQALKPGVTTRFSAEIILDEAAKWEARVQALQAGALRVYRFHATNSAEKKKGRVSTLSDWKY